jgi:hypothetical protein
VPWISEDGDPRRAWALSEVSLRKSRCSGASNPPDVQNLVETAQHGWTLSEREIPVAVLKPADDERWQGTVRGKDANSVSVFYSKSVGFEFAAKDHDVYFGLEKRHSVFDTRHLVFLICSSGRWTSKMKNYNLIRERWIPVKRSNGDVEQTG